MRILAAILLLILAVTSAVFFYLYCKTSRIAKRHFSMPVGSAISSAVSFRGIYFTDHGIVFGYNCFLGKSDRIIPDMVIAIPADASDNDAFVPQPNGSFKP